MPASLSRAVRWMGLLSGLGLAAAAFDPPVHAQFDSAKLSGIVRDEQGAVVPGATIRIIHEATRVERRHTSDTSGYYIAPALPPGTYQVEFELTGFTKQVRTGVKLDATASVQVDAVLRPGGVEETVTVTAESTPLQTNTGQVAKTIEAKQISELMLNGRNPLMLALLKPGVRGPTFSQFSPTSPFVAQQIFINGARSDENLITYDGVTATRTRSSVAAIGVPNVDTLQEIQVLTASYLPEHGRSSGGQIRFVTKSGGRDFHGDLYGFLRDESLDANTWARNSSPLASQNEAPAPFTFQQFGYDIGGPVFIPGRFNEGKDKVFFFWSQEFIRQEQPSTLQGTVPTERMRRGDFSELLSPTNPFYGRVVTIRDPLTGQPFPGNVIPPSRLSRNGLALLSMYPLPTPGFQTGANNWIADGDSPTRSRKDTLRLDFVPGSNDRISLRYSHFDWKFVTAGQGTFPLVRLDWNAPNDVAAVSWTRTLSSSLINEATVGFAQDRVSLNVWEGQDTHQRSRYGIDYPYIFPGTKEIEDKIPTLSISGLSEIDGSPYPAFSKGPIWQFSNQLTWLRGRHTFKLGFSAEYSGEDDFDQINVLGQPGDTNNQNGRFEFRDDRPSGTGNAIANAAMGLFTNYGEIGQKSLTNWRSLGIDGFVQDSWKARDDLTVEYGVRYAYWPPFHAQCNNIASFDPRFYDPARAANVDPRTGAILGGDRFNGIVLPGDGFPSGCDDVEATRNPEYARLFRGLPRGLSETHSTVFQPRFGMAWALDPRTVVRVGGGVFHTRVTLNDSTLLGGNPPIQFKVGVSNGLVDQPTGATRQDFPLVMTAQDPVFKHPTAYNWSLSFQRQLFWDLAADVTYVGRIGTHLQRERNINQLQPGTLQANPGINPHALRPFRGFAGIRLSENSGRSEYHGLQINLERRFRGGLGFGLAYTLSRSEDNGDGKRDLLYNAFDDSNYWGPSGYDRTHVLNLHFIYELPFWRDQDTLVQKLFGGWQVSGVTFIQSGAPMFVRRGVDRAGVGDTTAQPWDMIGDPSVANPSFSLGPNRDQNFWFNPAAFREPAAGTFGNSPRNNLRGPGFWSLDMALIKNVRLNTRGHRLQLRLEAFNVLNHPNLNNPELNPVNANFGRVTGKTGNRNIQLGVKFLF